VAVLCTAACGTRVAAEESNAYARYLPQPIQATAVPSAAPRTTAVGPKQWTADRGRIIAERALAWRNWPYSFGGGNESGPTYGHPVDHDSRNDANVLGFDCSGLVMYALAPWLKLHHDAATQYLETGKVHPALSALLPGDLVFWSKDRTIGGIGHVAIYVGNGYVVQAPRSGARITITPINQVEPGAIGTTRPLTN
jgi:cell wall-associated NlpC family hydrolase